MGVSLLIDLKEYLHNKDADLKVELLKSAFLIDKLEEEVSLEKLTPDQTWALAISDYINSRNV